MEGPIVKHVRAVLEFLPPSVNKLYVRTAKGMTKSTATKKFVNRAKTELVKQWFYAEKMNPNIPHRLTLHFYFPELENATYIKGKAKYRFKRQDVSNYIKILEDVIATAIGIDDSSTLTVVAHKSVDKECPRVEILLEESEDFLESE